MSLRGESGETLPMPGVLVDWLEALRGGPVAFLSSLAEPGHDGLVTVEMKLITRLTHSLQVKINHNCQFSTKVQDLKLHRV